MQGHRFIIYGFRLSGFLLIREIKNAAYRKTLAEATGDESKMNIPLGIVMQVLTGDAQHLGLLIGMNSEDPYCVVLRIECEDIMPLHDALIECFGCIDIEMDEDVDDVPWPFE